MHDEAERAGTAEPLTAAAIRFDGLGVGFPVAGGGSYPAVAPTDLQVGGHDRFVRKAAPLVK